MGLDSEALLTFVTIHQANGFSSAAEVLGRSQPAISRRIALLEDELGVPVFERASGGVVLSEAGRALLPHAERVLAALRDAESAIKALRTEVAGRGADREIDLWMIGGEAMIGLRYLLDIAPDLVCEHIASETMVVACSVQHRFAGKRLGSLAALCHEPWFAFRNAYDQRETFADNIFAQFQARGIGEVRWTSVDSLNAMKRLVEAGLGIALLPESAIDEERRLGSLATIPVADLHVANPIYAVLRRGGYLSPATLHLLALLRSAPGLANGRFVARQDEEGPLPPDMR